MKKSISISLLFSLSLFANEPSAFEAGNLDSPNPYGLTTSEKYILQNKKEIDRLKKESIVYFSKIQELEEKVEGLRSIVEGVDKNLNDLRLKFEKLLKDKESSKNELQNEIKSLNEDLNKTVTLQKENFEQIKSVLKELTSLIDNINNSYVSKEEFKKEMEGIYSYIDKKITSIKKLQQKKSLMSKSGAYVFKEAKRLFREKKYDLAKEYFEVSIKKHYKPATSSYYIGEICFYQKRYDCAVRYYKKSASLYSKSSFMPTLMLHTAVSLEKLGEKKQAKIFYENLIKKFPKTKAAKIAKNNLKKLR